MWEIAGGIVIAAGLIFLLLVAINSMDDWRQFRVRKSRRDFWFGH